MTLTRNAELPAAVRSSLPDHAQSIWRAAYNSATKTHPEHEEKCRLVAWEAVKRQYVKSWTRKNGERSMKQPTAFTETVAFSADRIDRETRTIFGVSLLGPESKNGYRFTEGAMRDMAGLIDGTRVYVNHQTGKTPDVRDLAGRIRNTRFETTPSLRVRGDVVLRKGDNAEMILDDAESDPMLAGFSIHHDSYHRRKDGQTEIYKGAKVHSTDYVADPATVGGLFENQNKEGEMQPEDVTIDWLQENRPEVFTEAVEAGKDNEKMEKELAASQAENTELKTKIAGFEQAEAAREKTALVESVLAESKLTDEAKTTIRPVLENAPDKDTMVTLVESIVKTAEAKVTKSQERTSTGDVTVDDLKKSLGRPTG